MWWVYSVVKTVYWDKHTEMLLEKDTGEPFDVGSRPPNISSGAVGLLEYAAKYYKDFYNNVLKQAYGRSQKQARLSDDAQNVRHFRPSRRTPR